MTLHARPWRLTLFALALVLAACSGGSDETETTSDVQTEIATETPSSETVEEAPSTSTTDTPTTTQAPTISEPEAEAITVEPATSQAVSAGPASFSAAGGITLELPHEVEVRQTQRCVVILEAGYAGESPFPPGVVIGAAEFVGAPGTNQVTPISTVDEWFASYELSLIHI